MRHLLPVLLTVAILGCKDDEITWVAFNAPHEVLPVDVLPEGSPVGDLVSIDLLSSLGQTKNTWELGAGATYTMAGFSPSVFYYHDFRLDADTVQGSLGYSLPIGIANLSVDTSIFIGNVRARDAAPDAVGPKVNDSYTYYGADVSLPYKLSANATFTVGAHYTDTRSLAIAGGPFGLVSRDNVWFTAGVSLGF